MSASPTANNRKKLAKLAKGWQQRHLRDEFAADPKRFERFSVSSGGLFVDYSKNHVDDETLSALLEFSDAAGFTDWRQRMFSGEAINTTENRAAWHVALRDTSLLTDALRKQVEAECDRERLLAEEIRSSGKYRAVLNLGIGGSQLGPELVCDQLSHLSLPEIQPYFLGDTDPRSRDRLLRRLDPATTIVIIASKSFTTAETRLNSTAVIDWLTDGGSESQRVAEQVIAISGNRQAVKALGVPESRCFELHDWVGGRFSLWSSIGLPIAIAFGNEVLQSLRDGARIIDTDFLESEPDRNPALILGMLDTWYSGFMSCPTRVILPYNAGLRLFPGFVQQLMMESCGKRVQRDGEPVYIQTAPVVWGGMAQTGQHAYFQLLHQGTQVIPADFIFARDEDVAAQPGYDTLAMNFVAQSEALMNGLEEPEIRGQGEEPALVAHRVCEGNRPSVSILMDRLDAHHLGQLIALYEHRTLVQAISSNINPFDQMGVELGKKLAVEVGDALKGNPRRQHDVSTRGMVEKLASLFRRGQ